MSNLNAGASPATVLILDDQVIVGEAVARVVGNAGYIISGPFCKVSTALMAIKQSTPDIAFLDIQMSDGLTSVEVANELIERGVPITFLSGHGQNDLLPSHLAQLPILSKPARLGDLLQAITQMLRPVS